MRTATICASMVLFLGLVTLTPAHSATTKGGYFACVTREAWDELSQHIARKDRRGADYLVEKKLCLVTKGGVEVSVLESSWGTAKVRVYFGNTSAVVWTNTENIQE